MPVSLFRPRRAKASPLWQCLSEHREAFFGQYGARFEGKDGWLRPEVRQTLDAFKACGDLSRGFARLHCDHCGHDYLIAFSCKQRYFCPSCHQKKVQQFGEFVRHEVAQRVPHRQIVLTIPKRLRRAFQFDRKLLTDLCQAAWLSLRDVIRLRLGSPKSQPGVIVAIQTFGDYLNFHPHLHILITDGAFVDNRTFHALHRTDWEQVAELLRNRVLTFFVKKKKLSAKEARNMRQWHHSGFGIHAGHRIQRDDHDALENLAQYILRNPFSLEKMTYYPETGQVIYRSKRNHATKRLWETYDGPAFIAAITRHIPIPGQHLVRYYGAYSNRARGERRKRAEPPSTPSAVGTSLPGCLSYADFAQKKDHEEQSLQAQAYEAYPQVQPHTDAYSPPAENRKGGDNIEVIELPPKVFPRIPRKKWRELIQKVWEVDPLICPKCACLMRVAGLLEDPDEAAKLLNALGWLAYATDSQGARAPPPGVDPSVPELPFTSEHDGVAYELEPWEQARRNRLQAYARERDQVAGIVIYDGEWNEANWTPSEADAWPPSIDESQASPFPDDADQRPPNWDSDPCHNESSVPDWEQMPLTKWAAQSNQWDDIDQSPPPEWEAEAIDQSPQYWQGTPLAQWSHAQDDWDGIDPVPTDHEPVFYTD